MEMFEKLKGMQKDKKMLAAVTVLGMAGLLLIMISSFLPDKKEEKLSEIPQASSETYDSYCSDTEKRLENFLRSVLAATRGIFMPPREKTADQMTKRRWRRNM